VRECLLQTVPLRAVRPWADPTRRARRRRQIRCESRGRLHPCWAGYHSGVLEGCRRNERAGAARDETPRRCAVHSWLAPVDVDPSGSLPP
jgi:hypothetical protein